MTTLVVEQIPEEISGPGCCPVSTIALAAHEDQGQSPGRSNTAPLLPTADPVAYVQVSSEGDKTLHLMVENLHCAACIRKIEGAVMGLGGVIAARVNMSTRRLRVSWQGGDVDGLVIMRKVAALGYPAAPFDPESLKSHDDFENRRLLAAMAVAGFAAANVMLLSVAVWAGAFSYMGDVTRGLFHWISALIAMPAVAYSGQPFFRSAIKALRVRQLNMDVPISLAVVLAAGMSLFQTIRGGEHAYFDASVTLLFFLLVGRYLDNRARARARATAEHLLALSSKAATVLGVDGAARAMPVNQLRPGMIVLVAAGERVAADGLVAEGQSLVDSALVTGESLSSAVGPGSKVYAGTVNIDAPLQIRVEAAAEDTLLAEIVRLVESAEQGRAKYVRLAEKAAQIYAPTVHVLAAATFIGWLVFAGTGWEPAAMAAIAVLIITCPCALGLAVPVVQVVASGLLLSKGVLVKSGDGLERIARCDYVVFDKTGTLTCGEPRMLNPEALDIRQSAMVAALASNSRHPLSRAAVLGIGGASPVAVSEVREQPGAGLSAVVSGKQVRLGSRAWCDVSSPDSKIQEVSTTLELWFREEGAEPVCLNFSDLPRPDAARVVSSLLEMGIKIEMLSGDRKSAVQATASALGITNWRGECLPDEKVRRLNELSKAGYKVLMVGDGLNDAPALASGFASISPTSAPDISQTAADLVFQGGSLKPVLDTIKIARAATRLVKQNFTLAVAYNLIAVPLAVSGLATPLVAAIAMSSSSVLVTLNALRLRLMGRPWI